jgi:hypothetical protein
MEHSTWSLGIDKQIILHQSIKMNEINANIYTKETYRS